MYARFLTDLNNQQEPPRAANPGDTPTYMPNGDAAQQANNKLAWERGKMICAKENNMNRALIERLLELIPTSYKKDFMTVFLRNQNIHFERAFCWFYNKYGTSDKEDREKNQASMGFDWTI